jgi:Protein of unknown function (DUF2569)
MSDTNNLDLHPLQRTSTAGTGPKGIGGWLILPIIGLSGTIILTLVNFWGVITQWEGIQLILQGGTDKLASLRFPLGLSMVMGITIIALAVLCLYRIFTYSPSVPKLMTFFYIWLGAATLGDVIADKMISSIANTPEDPSNLTSLLRVAIAAAIWIPYFRMSKRAANTFRAPEAETDKKIGDIFS